VLHLAGRFPLLGPFRGKRQRGCLLGTAEWDPLCCVRLSSSFHGQLAELPETTLHPVGGIERRGKSVSAVFTDHDHRAM
jgi:hypothetical protein